ncbi:MAG: 1,4-dihydroxy-2-naphthoate polyprenyltransferase [Gemmatimonadota bacterium]|nr:1,4-dihydroxy-2-naphthoate polyprenyltransferase [Gemmatimonadota bacterium]
MAGHPSRVRAWALAARPKTLPAAVAPVLVGTGVAWHAGGFRAGPATAAAVGALLLQVGSNLANDVFDFERGSDREGRTGPLRVTQAGLLTPGQVRAGMVVVFGLALLAGLYLAAEAGWPVVAIGLAAIAAAVAYTGGPFPLGYYGLGDLFVLAFFGFAAVCGTAYVQVLAVPPAAWPAALATGCLVTAILVVNDVRDVEHDRESGKRTLPVRFGRGFGEAEYVALLAAGFLAPPAMALAGLAPPAVLLVLLALPLAPPLVRSLRRERGAALNRTLAGTARLLLAWSVLFTAGFGLGPAS